MGCCCSNDSDEAKEEIVRIRTTSRIPPSKAIDTGSGYGTLSNEEDALAHDDNEVNQHEPDKGEQKEPTVWTPQPCQKVFALLPLRSPSPVNVPEDPFTTNKKRKLKRNYAIRGGSKSKKFTQGSAVQQRIEVAQHENAPSGFNNPNIASHDIHEESEANGIDDSGNGVLSTLGDSNPIPHEEDHSPDAAKITTKREEDEESQTASLSEDVTSISGTSDTSRIDLQELHGKKVKTKKNTPKKIASKLGKLIPGKKKKKREDK